MLTNLVVIVLAALGILLLLGAVLWPLSMVVWIWDLTGHREREARLEELEALIAYADEIQAEAHALDARVDKGRAHRA